MTTVALFFKRNTSSPPHSFSMGSTSATMTYTGLESTGANFIIGEAALVNNHGCDKKTRLRRQLDDEWL